MSIIFHPRHLEHRQGVASHPESPERLVAVRARLIAEGLWREALKPAAAGREAIECVHRSDYLERLASFGTGWWDEDTYVRPETYELARLAAGAALRAADETMRTGRPALALVRPPGHHATPGEAMGFCYLNNAAIAAEALRAAGCERVAIVNPDVHHGNGTQAAFYGRADVLFFSTHQWPLYPGTGRAEEVGEGDGKGFNLNVPLPPGSGDATLDAVMDRLLAPVLAQYRPSAVVVSLGVDAHYLDPLAQLAWSTPGMVRWVDRLRQAAAPWCEGRVVFCLEGGYHPEALADVVAGVAAGLEGREVEARFEEVADDAGRGLAAVAAAGRAFGEYWKL